MQLFKMITFLSSSSSRQKRTPLVHPFANYCSRLVNSFSHQTMFSFEKVTSQPSPTPKTLSLYNTLHVSPTCVQIVLRETFRKGYGQQNLVQASTPELREPNKRRQYQAVVDDRGGFRNGVPLVLCHSQSSYSKETKRMCISCEGMKNAGEGEELNTFSSAR